MACHIDFISRIVVTLIIVELRVEVLPCRGCIALPIRVVQELMGLEATIALRVLRHGSLRSKTDPD